MSEANSVSVYLGPVVRVTPDEVHIRDCEWSHVLYAGPGHVSHLGWCLVLQWLIEMQIRDRDPSLAHTAGTADGSMFSAHI